MASFGQRLRQAREARNITLQEIAATTKIGTRALQALEWERFEQLPGGIFNKGFVRAYARCVGLDEEETVAAYMEAAKVAPPETDMQTLATQVEAARPKRGGGPNAGTVVGILAVLVALVLGGLWLREHRRESREAAEAQNREARAAVSVTAPTVTPPVASPVTSSGTQTDPNGAVTSATNSTVEATQNTATPVADQKTASAPAPEVGATPVEVSITATSRAWISVLSDDKAAETFTMDPSKPDMSSRSYKAKERVRLTLGNPTGVTVTYNGKPAGALGKAGQRAVVTFTAEGIEKQ